MRRLIGFRLRLGESIGGRLEQRVSLARRLQWLAMMKKRDIPSLQHLCLLTPPYLLSAWITKDNVNRLLIEAGAEGEVDLLSLDIDGNDYYIWEAISAINPRLCVFETHNIIPGNLSLTIPYEDNFNCWAKKGTAQDFRSVSLLAMKKLAERKGYRLIGAHRHGFNVFFLRNDIGQDSFPEVSIEHVHANMWTRMGQKDRWPLVKDMPWVSVE